MKKAGTALPMAMTTFLQRREDTQGQIAWRPLEHTVCGALFPV